MSGYCPCDVHFAARALVLMRGDDDRCGGFPPRERYHPFHAGRGGERGGEAEEEVEEEELRAGIDLRRGGVWIITGATTGSVATSGEATHIRRWSGLAAVAEEEGAEGVWILGKSPVRWARLCARRTSCPSAATT